MKKLLSSAILLATVVGAVAVSPLVACDNSKNTPPAASPADAASGASAPSAAPAPKATGGGGGW